jgi:oligoribonuclease (3'-5' exoribonuclease)
VLHYRNIDVSTLTNIFRIFYPGAPKYERQGDPTHRVLDDLHNSINTLKHYKQIQRPAWP